MTLSTAKSSFVNSYYKQNLQMLLCSFVYIYDHDMVFCNMHTKLSYFDTSKRL